MLFRSILRLKLKEAGGEPVYLNGCLVFGIKLDNEQLWNVVEGWK